MIKLEDVVPIIFPPGYFGHYLFWVLNNFTEKGDCSQPKELSCKAGSSHFTGMNRDMIISWDEVLQSTKYSNFEMIHQYVDVNLLIYTDVKLLSETVKRCIVINQDPNFYLAARNMIWEKTYHSDSAMILDKSIRDEFRSLGSAAEQREYVSYKGFHNIKYSSSEDYTNTVFSIEIDDLLYNFEEIIKKVIAFLNTTLTTSMETILNNHKTMMMMQKHLNKDADIQIYLNAFSKNEEISLPENATIIDEAYIQHYLREELNLEIKCFKLEEFPKTTTELHKITYPAKELQRIE